MKSLLRPFALLVLLTLCCGSARAQNKAGLASGVTSVLHPSPNAASLGKFTEVPVSLYTGLPSTAVPIWQLQRGDIALDVSLAYHGGGIKADEAASWVGLGWALNAGGMITRSARGLPDNLNTYKQVEIPLLNRFLGLAGSPMSQRERQDYVLNVYSGVTDAEPDLYSLSAGNLSCQFFMNKDGVFVTTARELNLKIQYEALDAHGTRYTWLVTDGKGVQYKFNDAEHTTTTPFTVGKDGTTNDNGSTFDGDVSWAVNEVEDTKGNAVRLAYARDGSAFVNITSEYVTTVAAGDARCTGKADRGYGYAANQGNVLRLTSITSGQEEVRFVPAAAERQDLAYGRALERVEIYYAGVAKRAFRLYDSYFACTATGSRGTYCPSTQNQFRLRLDSLREESADGRLAKPAYRFAYAPGELPYRGSAAQDHWGYYNGQDNRSRVGYTLGGQRLGANKTPDPAFALIGTLVGVRYPTGGSVAYAYEANRYPRILSETAPLPVDSTFVQAEVNTYLGTTDLGFRTERTFEITPDIVTAAPGSPDDGKVVMQLRMNKTVDGNTEAYQNGYTQYVQVVAAGTTTAIPFVLEADKGRIARLPPGRYVLEIYVEKEFSWPQDQRIIHLDASLSADVTASPYVASKDNVGPGLRIKQITSLSGSGPAEIRTYDYTDPATGRTSGQLSNLPDYQRNQRVDFLSNPGGNDSRPYQCDCQFFTSNSHYPLLDTRGSYLAYSYVSEYFDADKTQGRKAYRYTNYDWANDLNATPAFPYPPTSPQGWKRGLPLLEQVYAGANASSGAEAVPVQTEATTYGSPIASLDWSYGVKMANVFIANNLLSGDDVGLVSDLYSSIQTFTYRLETDSHQLQTKVTRQFAQNGTFQTSSSYSYTPDTYQVSRITSDASDGSTTVQRFVYPSDYRATASSSPLLTGLLAANRLTVPVEQSALRLTGKGAKLVSSVAHEYDFAAQPNGSKLLYLKKIYSANTALADTSSHYNFQALPAQFEEKAFFAKVTSRGQALVQQDRRYLTSGYHWGYEDRYPLAACTNATDTEFFYEGFEESASATTGKAHAGTKYAPDYTAMWTPPNGRRYVLSYWYRQGDAWYYRQTAYSNAGVSLTGGDAYDEVCIYPQDAQLTTYTYEPLVGMTSQTDPSGRTTTYEYDGLGRLLRARDEQGHILAEQQYHYAGQ